MSVSPTTKVRLSHGLEKGGMAMWTYRLSLMSVCGLLLLIIAVTGLASAEEKYGYVDTTGKLVIPPLFRSAEPFSEGLAAIQTETGGKWGYIDKTGTVVIPPMFATGDSFKAGRAAVQTEMDGKWGYINRTGKLVATPQFEEVGSFIDGLAVVAVATK